MKGICLAVLFISAGAVAGPQTKRDPISQPFGNTAHWSVRGGLTVALHGVPITGDTFGAPRGLLRIMLPLHPEYKVLRSLNFIAVEPSTLEGYRDYSELQHSPSDGQPGIKFWFDKAEKTAGRLRQTIRMEKFANGAHPYLIAELRADRPMEVRFEVYAEQDSAPMKMCILTATMGNFQRIRRLHLKDRVALASVVFPEDPGAEFTRHAVFPLRELIRDKAGVFVAADGDEADPRVLSKSLPASSNWRYEGLNFTQYWRQPEPVDADLRVLVNARKTYWLSCDPIPGGKAFENFELNAAFHPGQVFTFGVKLPGSRESKSAGKAR